MAGEIKLAIASETRDAVRGVKDIGKALDGVVDDLEKVDRESGATEDALTKDFRKIAQSADKASDEVKRDFTGAFDEVKDEAGSSGREAAASFSGGFEDVADFVQETLANALGGFGPIGAAAGIALAAGLGAALSALTAQQERLEATREAARDLASTLYENRGELPIADQVSRAFDLITSERAAQGVENLTNQWVDLGTNLDALRETAKLTKTPLEQLVRGLSGSDLPTAKRQLEAVEDALADLNDEVTAGTGSWSRTWEVMGESQTLETTRKLLEDQVRSLELVEEATGAVSDAYGAEAEAAEAAQQRISDTRSRVADEATASYDRIREAAVDASTSEEGVFDLNTWLATVEQSRAAADTYRQNLSSMKLSPEEWENLLSLPEEARTQIVNSYAISDDSTKERIRSSLRDAGSTGGSEASVSFSESFNPDADVEISVDVDDAKAEAALDGLEKSRTVDIKPKVVDSAGVSAQLDGLTRARSASISAHASTASAETAFSNLYNRWNGKTVRMVASIVDRNGKAVV